MLVFLLVAVLASLLGYSLPDTAESIFRRVIILFTVISIYMLMPYLFMTLFVQDKRFYLQGAQPFVCAVQSRRLFVCEVRNDWNR